MLFLSQSSKKRNYIPEMIRIKYIFVSLSFLASLAQTMQRQAYGNAKTLIYFCLFHLQCLISWNWLGGDKKDTNWGNPWRIDSLWCNILTLGVVTMVNIINLIKNEDSQALTALLQLKEGQGQSRPWARVQSICNMTRGIGPLALVLCCCAIWCQSLLEHTVHSCWALLTSSEVKGRPHWLATAHIVFCPACKKHWFNPCPIIGRLPF